MFFLTTNNQEVHNLFDFPIQKTKNILYLLLELQNTF